MDSATALVPLKPMVRKLGLSRFLYAPFHAQLVVTRKCNLSCGYCNEFDDFSPPVPFEELCKRIDKIRELGTWAVEFTGGEPLEHPQIVELVKYAKSRGFYKVMLISNAYLFNEAMVHKFNEAGLDDLQVSIDGVTTNDTTIKVLKPLKKKLETIAKHAKFRVTLNSVVGSAPPGEAIEVIAFAREHNFIPRVCLIHGGDGQLSLSTAQLDEYTAIKRALGKRFKDAGDYRTVLMEKGASPFKCRAGSRYLYIDEFGYVRWCSQSRELWGKTLESYTLDDLKEQFDTQKDCAPGCTVGCVRTASGPDRFRRQKRPQPPAPAPSSPEQLVQIGKKSHTGPDAAEASGTS
jgi:MoaA/NifB/PqqE/SkfB family radical SAM enzyme